MKLKSHGKSISSVEVLNISEFGIWIFVGAKEYFLTFKEFPWFKDATLVQIQNVELLHNSHLHWRDIDVDLHIESLENTEKYSLVCR
ncbi:hypothetical protein MNBD_BACTEROID05-1242 [hydrothermal vent metagenome]|uniref:DUF2442 domain-containing protein n=1 Tax=hydrothermal vent metagenome TaxID=652676 RepID=A0A3B0T6Q5_9ZZZZ